jgi:2-polyprenyl-3-methyl-5-hydroxy-6-metoxy-1,4-benzoquinol methylase
MSLSSLIRNHCLLCGKDKFIDVFGKEHFLVRCKNCGLVFSREIPSTDELRKYYDEYPTYETISHLTIKRYNEILDKLEKYRSTNNLLETGCGFGYFLDEARKRNWNVYGTEFSRKTIMACEKKNIIIGESVEAITIKCKNKFDAVVSIEVIEHLTDPNEEVKKYSEAIREGGVIYITTPNFNSLSRRILGTNWNVLIYPEHLHYFTSSTLHQMMKKHGFKSIQRSSSGLSLGRLIYTLRSKKAEALNEPNDYDYNERDRQLRDSIEDNFLLRPLKYIINAMLSFFRLGDALKYLYLKK